MGGAGRLHAVVASGEPRPGDARKAMFAIWAAVNLIKQVIVVDDDIDPWDAEQVEWAMRDADASRSAILSSFPACAPTARSRSSRAA